MIVTSVMKMDVAVVIPNWNGANWIGPCLQSLEAQSYPAFIIVVDNGSTDDSVEFIEKQFPKVRLIKLPKNTGFAGGVNAGISNAVSAGFKMVALFNNDAVADKNWLKNLVEAMNTQNEVGIVTCKLMLADKKHLDSTGDFYSIWGMPFPRGRNQVDGQQFNEPGEVFGATGGASLYRSMMLKDIGFFDEHFFAYYEDVDISFRARLKGWKIFYNPKALAYHSLSKTSSAHPGLSRYHATKNFYLLYLKNMPASLFWKYLPLVVLQSCRLFIGSIARGYVLTFIAAWLKAVYLIPYTLKQRRQIQKQRRISPKEIDSLLYKNRPPKIPVIS